LLRLSSSLFDFCHRRIKDSSRINQGVSQVKTDNKNVRKYSKEITDIEE
jgi:hypothetical protein